MKIRYKLTIKPVGYNGKKKQVEYSDSRRSLEIFMIHHQLRYPFRFLYRLDFYER